jgi:hypothetical protein
LCTIAPSLVERLARRRTSNIAVAQTHRRLLSFARISGPDSFQRKTTTFTAVGRVWAIRKSRFQCGERGSVKKRPERGITGTVNHQIKAAEFSGPTKRKGDGTIRPRSRTGPAPSHEAADIDAPRAAGYRAQCVFSLEWSHETVGGCEH